MDSVFFIRFAIAMAVKLLHCFNVNLTNFCFFKNNWVIRCGKFQTDGLLLLNLPFRQLFVLFYAGLLINLLLIVFFDLVYEFR